MIAQRLTRLVSTLVVISLLALSGVTVLAQETTLTGEPVRIGVAVAQTSNVSLFGQEQVIGAEIARDYFNAQGGINGRPIELVFQDTAGDEAGAINAFQALLNDPTIVGIVGPTLSQQAFAADPLAEQAGVPVVGPSNTAGGVPEIGEYIARVSAPVAVVAPNAVRAVLEENPDIQDVAVFFAQNDAFSVSETGTFQQAVTDLGLNIVTVQEFQTTDTDFTTQATNAIAEQPDLIIISGLAADGGNLIRQLRELGYTGAIIGGNGLNSPNMFPVCEQYCDGVTVAQAYSPLFESEMNTAFGALYSEAQGKNPSQFSAQAFAAVQVFVESLTALDTEVGLDTLEIADLRTQLNAQILAGSYDTPLGTISFTEEGDVVQAQFYVARIAMADDNVTGAFELVGAFDAPVLAEATPEATAES